MMVQRYDMVWNETGSWMQPYPDGCYVEYTDYATLEKRCEEAEKRAGDRWKALDAERQDHAITKKENTELLQKVQELGAENARLKEEIKGMEFLVDKALNPSRYGGT